jgi:hypothetical protein
LIIQAGPVALLQATLIAIITFLVIYFAGTRWFGLDKYFAATLGVGGSVCGVSAAIAVGGAIKAKKRNMSQFPFQSFSSGLSLRSSCSLCSSNGLAFQLVQLAHGSARQISQTQLV